MTIYTVAHAEVRADELVHTTGDWMDWQEERQCVLGEENGWTPETDHAVRARPVKYPGTLRRLRAFFSYNAEYGAMRQTVTNRVERVAAETGLKKNTPYVLWYTYGTLVAA